MTCIVAPCFHWIGFHIVEALLDRGEEVIGLDEINTDKKENLSLFLGRNSSFEQMENINDWKGQTCSSIYSIGNHAFFQGIENVEAENYFYLTRDQNMEKSLWTIVHYPVIFGEWMSREEDGVYTEEEFIYFDSDTFKNTGVYVQDFTKALMRLKGGTNHLSRIECTVQQKENDKNKSDNELVITKQKPILEQLESVNEHYEKFKLLY